MSVASPDWLGLTVANRPLSSPLKDVWGLSRHMAGQIVKSVAACATLPGDAIRGDITITTRVCLELPSAR